MFRVNGIQHSKPTAEVSNVKILSVTLLNCYADFHYSECHYTECCYALCHYAEYNLSYCSVGGKLHPLPATFALESKTL